MKKVLKRQAGLTLVELMVATTLSLVLLAGVMLVFSANKTTYQMQSGLGTLQENGRYALRRIAADLQMAGFSGCLSPHIEPRILVDTGSPAYLEDLAAGEFFAGVNNDTGSTAYDSRAMYGGPAGAGTDSIEVRGALHSDVHYVSGEIASGADVVLTESVTSGAAPGYFVIADCGGADIFSASNDLSSGSTTISPTNPLSRGYAKDSVVKELATHTYFVADTGRDNTAGQDIIALYRFDGATAQELVDGVEDLQIEYALDTVPRDGRIDAFVDPDGVTDWGDVMAVRVSLLLNSVNAASTVAAPYTFFPAGSTQINPPTTDRRLRQEFTALVTVRNSVL
jgi:type IV pilus assembly protein PilW